LLDPFRPQTQDDLELLDEIQSDIQRAFVDHVRSRRAGKLKGGDEEIFSGRVWLGDRGKALGLVDELGSPEVVLRARFGDKLRIKHYVQRRSWLQRRLGIDRAAAELLRVVEERLAFGRFGL
jgi:serine protease SohB